MEEAEKAKWFGIILGTWTAGLTGGDLKMLQAVARKADKPTTVILLSEILPEASGIEAWVQIACPWLSIDRGASYSSRPLLNPYEAIVVLGHAELYEYEYPIDFYAKNAGPWTNYLKPENVTPKTTSCKLTSCACAK